LPPRALATPENGVADPAQLAGGIGVSNTRARLEQLYGSAQQVEFRNGDGGGLLVNVTIPFRPAGKETASGEISQMAKA